MFMGRWCLSDGVGDLKCLCDFCPIVGRSSILRREAGERRVILIGSGQAPKTCSSPVDYIVCMGTVGGMVCGAAGMGYSMRWFGRLCSQAARRS